MELNYLTEAFKSLNLLTEEDFNLNDAEDKEEMKDFDNEEEKQDFIDVIDPEAEDETEIEDSYIGKVICDCQTCHSKIYKDATGIVVDPESGLVNVGEECPYCYDSSGYKVIGEVAAYTAEEKEPEPEADAEVEDDLGLDSDVEEKPAEEELPEEEHDDNDEGDLAESLTENLENVEVKTEEGAVEITKEPGKTTIEIKEEAEEPIEAEVVPDEAALDIEPEINGEEIVPVSPETEDIINAASEEENTEETIVDDEVEPLPEENADDVDYDLEDFDEESFDGLGESYLKKVYENVNSFKTTQVRQKENKLVVEGLIEFNSGKTKKTSFVFEANEANKKGNVKFLGENTQISRGKKSFSLEGNIKDKKFIAESFGYHYMTKDANDISVRIYGKISNK